MCRAQRGERDLISISNAYLISTCVANFADMQAGIATDANDLGGGVRSHFHNVATLVFTEPDGMGWQISIGRFECCAGPRLPDTSRRWQRAIHRHLCRAQL